MDKQGGKVVDCSVVSYIGVLHVLLFEINVKMLNFLGKSS